MNFLAKLKVTSPTAKDWKNKRLKKATLWGIDWEEKNGEFSGDLREEDLIKVLKNDEVIVAGFHLKLPVEPLAV